MSTQFDKLTNIMAQLETMTQSNERRESGNIYEDRLPKRFARDAEFVARITADKNGVLLNEFCQYAIEATLKNTQGEEYKKWVLYRIEGEFDSVRKKTDYTIKDPIYPIVKELKNFRLNPNLTVTVYAEITEISRGASEKFTTGPCVLHFTGAKGESFARALKAEMKNIMDDSEGRELLSNTLNPSQKGMLCQISIAPGSRGVPPPCTVKFKDRKGLVHSFEPEVIEKITDIKTEYCIPFGPDNDRNGVIVKEHYKKLLSATYSSPDDLDDKLPKVSPATKPSKAPPSLPIQDNDFDAELEATLAKGDEDNFDAELEAALAGD